MDASQFRTDFPEFGDASIYPDAQINLWLRAATNFVDPCQWGDMANLAIELFTAHNLSLWLANFKSASVGGTPGGGTGNISQKRVADGSISYDNNPSTEKGAGQWNLTTYGKLYINYAQMFGAGAIQL